MRSSTVGVIVVLLFRLLHLVGMSYSQTIQDQDLQWAGGSVLSWDWGLLQVMSTPSRSHPRPLRCARLVDTL